MLKKKYHVNVAHKFYIFAFSKEQASNQALKLCPVSESVSPECYITTTVKTKKQVATTPVVSWDLLNIINANPGETYMCKIKAMPEGLVLVPTDEDER